MIISSPSKFIGVGFVSMGSTRLVDLESHAAKPRVFSIGASYVVRPILRLNLLLRFYSVRAKSMASCSVLGADRRSLNFRESEFNQSVKKTINCWSTKSLLML